MSVDWRGRAADAAVERASRDALKTGAEIVGAYADQTVPHEEGTLQRSRSTTVTGDTATISYGGAAEAYARIQHQARDFQHAPGRRARWLALALDEQSDQVHAALAERIRQALS